MIHFAMELPPADQRVVLKLVDAMLDTGGAKHCATRHAPRSVRKYLFGQSSPKVEVVIPRLQERR